MERDVRTVKKWPPPDTHVSRASIAKCSSDSRRVKSKIALLKGHHQAKTPRRLTHCLNKECKGILETVCRWAQYGKKKFGLSRRVLMRQCVKCGNRYIDGICARKNEIVLAKLDKTLLRKRAEEGLIDLDKNGNIVWHQKQDEDDLW